MFYSDSENLKKHINIDIEYIKRMLRDSYDNLDKIEKSKLEVGEVVLLKDSLDKGIVKGFSVGSTNVVKAISDEQVRYIQVHIVCLKGEITTRLENLVVYSDAAKLLYSKKIPVIIKDEIPF